MLLKLLKYDFRAMWKQFYLIWGAALIIALVNRFTLFNESWNSASTASAIAFGGVIGALCVISITFVISRFERGLLGDEGYLMHTLPVRSWQLVASKLICGTVTWVVSGVVALLTPFLMAPIHWSDLLSFHLWQIIFQGFAKHPDTLALLAEFLLVMLAGIVLSISVMYLAMAIGHLFTRRRKLISVAAFIGLYILLGRFYHTLFSYRILHHLVDVLTVNVHGALFTTAGMMLLPAALFLAAVCWILEYRLNLE